MEPSQDQLKALLQAVAATVAEEIDCDEFLRRVAAYLEQFQDCESLPAEFRQVAQHLEVCPPCREEFDALVRSRCAGYEH